MIPMSAVESWKPALLAALAFVGLFFAMADGAHAAPYCVLRKPFSPPQPNCFQFYLADTAVAPPRTMAVVGPAGCAVTPYAAGQGWAPDPTVPGPHATGGAGDAAMGVVSPYFSDAYGCHAAGSGTSGAGTGGTGMPGGGSGCQTVQTINQPESRDATGKITVEAATISVMSCANAAQIYIYKYLNRPGFRAISPPNWAQPLGGRDFQTFDEALGAATGEAASGGRQGGGAIQVTAATYGENCAQPKGNVTRFLAAACDGKASCEYAVHWETIGDPAYGCQKDFSVVWSCSVGPGGTDRLGGEAGFGSVARLSCAAH